MNKRTNISPLSILAAIADKKLFAPWFRDPATWAAWQAFLAALFALPMAPDQLAIYQQCTGRTKAPISPFCEAWLVCGRRAGKSFILALCAVFLACFYVWTPYLTPGEVGTILIVARDRRQARTILRYIRALLTRVPMLARMIERETAEGFDLKNHIAIEVGTASFKTVRGYTLVAALLDELAFWPTDDAADPDVEVINAIKPGMLTVPNATLLCASSPFARRGALWEAWHKHYGKDDDPVLVWQAETRLMNPTVPQSAIDQEMEADPARASAEYLAQFRSDVESFVSRDIVDAAIVPDRYELPRVAGIRYVGFADAAGGGGGGDSFTAAVAHFDRSTKHLVLDAVRERRPPFSPEATCREFAEFFKSYGVYKITADHWAGDFPPEQFRKNGVACERSERVKSDIYKEMLPWLNSHRVELYNLPRMIAQLCDLERKVARGGNDSISHPPAGHDDLINAASGALTCAAAHQPLVISDAVLLAAAQPTNYTRLHGRPNLMGSRCPRPRSGMVT